MFRFYYHTRHGYEQKCMFGTNTDNTDKHNGHFIYGRMHACNNTNKYTWLQYFNIECFHCARQMCAHRNLAISIQVSISYQLLDYIPLKSRGFIMIGINSMEYSMIYS